MKKLIFIFLFIPFALQGQTKISDLSSATSVTGTELVPIVQGGVTKNATINILNYGEKGIFNVLNYGADPTGVALSTTAIQSALDACVGGGVVYIPDGIYLTDHIVIKYAKTRIIGSGKYTSILRLKDNADVNHTFSTLIYFNGKDSCEVRDLGLDGNMFNQTYLDNGSTETAKCIGILVNDTTLSATDYAIIDNCYVTNFTKMGILLRGHDNNVCRISNNIVRRCGWGGIGTMGYTYNTMIEGNYVDYCNIAIDMYGTGGTVQNNYIGTLTGVYGGGDDYRVGIAVEWDTEKPSPSNWLIQNNMLVGGNSLLTGIGILNRGRNITIDGNQITGISDEGTEGNGIWLSADTNTVVSNNIIYEPTNKAYYGGIQCIGTHKAMFKNNVIKGARLYALRLQTNSDSCIIEGNYLQGTTDYVYVLNIGSGCDYGLIQNNTIASRIEGEEITNSGTDNTIINNYSVLNKRMLPDIGTNNTGYTATSDGTGDGIIRAGSQFITVTSANTAYICCLPVASTGTIGTVISGRVGANGFELRVAASQATTVYLNNVTTNVEAAIPADTNFRVTQIDATHWILECTTNLGAVLTAIVPDAV